MYRPADTRQLQMMARMLLLPATIAVIAAGGAWPAHAQGTPERTVEQYSCKDVIRESGTQRDVAVAFLHGYLLGKSGTSKFNLDTLRKQTDDFIEICLENSADKAVDVMSSVKK